ncbi:hypothetical protein VSS37_05345 [Candidatus Thiothrix sp. Deng01]|uniref:Uncharacterized protein n=2 Tax=Thiothrix TaxID=1030 RepID=A0A7L6AVV8_9GAMM|nr:hypothetical protein [Candidatus Thiothrix sp. Deng01]MEB4590395.1 hypothetical protein [Candidatus Thiothrix sp. Deng01]QLQ33097.1 MAG: hypothetical protein HZT40_17545 [Candidatus Thiothrix singaporensis]
MWNWFLGLSLHSRIAIMVAPVMLIGGYGLMDLWLNKDKPQQEMHVATRQLAVDGQCLLATNQCNLSYNGMKVSMMRGEASAPGLVRIEVRVNQPIRGVQFALVHGEEEQHVMIDRPPGEDVWVGEFPDKLLQPQPSAVRMALAQTGRISYAEIPAQF